nr:acyltransferase [uncultured Holophaga sp.]
METPAAPDRIDTLDTLRGLMALAVASYHLSIWTHLFEAGTRRNDVLACLGNYGVEGFFILSGFCFFHIYRETRWSAPALARFHIKRFLRIAPLYFLVVLLNLLLRQPVGPSVTPRMLVENFSLTFGLFHPNHAMVLGGWSIGIEYVFYFAFPLLALLARRRLLLYVLFAALVAWSLPWSFGKVQAATLVGDQKFHTYVQIPNHAFLFLAGGIAAHWRSLTQRRLPWQGFLLLLVPLCVLGLQQIPHFYDHFDVLAGGVRYRLLGICGLAVLLFAFVRMPRHRSLRPLTLIGDWSYASYLLHPLAYFLVTHLLPGSIAAWPKVLLSLAATLALAAIVHRWVERPAMALGRHLASRIGPAEPRG